MRESQRQTETGPDRQTHRQTGRDRQYIGKERQTDKKNKNSLAEMEQLVQWTWKGGLRQNDVLQGLYQFYCFGIVVIAARVVDVASMTTVIRQDQDFQSVFPMYFTFMHLYVMFRKYRRGTHYKT